MRIRHVLTRSALTAVGSALAFTCVTAPAARAADVTTALSGSTASSASTASAAADVPQSGSSVALTEDGDMVLECNGTLHRLDLHGTGQLVVGDKVTGQDGTSSVALTTASEDLLGYDPTLGTVTVTESAPATGVLSSPVPGKTFPAAESFAQDVMVSMEHTPCDDSGAPVTFRNTAPFTLLNDNLKAFPPQNSVYVLPGQVELKQVAAPDQPTATLLQFPVTVTHNT
jgi:hypothetical protein